MTAAIQDRREARRRPDEGTDMAENEFTLDALRRILRESAGENAALAEDILDLEFGALGYESIALLETGGRIEREYGITLDDSVIYDAATPRALIDAVNERLSARAGARD